MKEVTEWDNKPREMWVWNNDIDNKVKAKVIAILKENEDRADCRRHVIILSNYGYNSLERCEHCAEIDDIVEDEPKLMTYKQLSRWLREKPNREFMYEGSSTIFSLFNYHIEEADWAVREDMIVREGDGDWRHPTTDLLCKVDLGESNAEED